VTVQIITGDARANISTIGDVDVVITDPVWPNCPHGLLIGHDRPGDLLAETLADVSAKRVVIILRNDSDPRFLNAVPDRWPFVCLQTISYIVPTYHGRVLGGTEIAYCFGNPIPSREGQRVIPTLGPKARPRDRAADGHPCARALVHMEWLINWWSLPGETVLDPFCGSGTIPIAAHRHGRHGIGIEIDPSYAALARERIASDRPLLAPVDGRNDPQHVLFAEVAAE
jgi:site-specific DNA-methyltransferase (adenine-specific)